MVFLQIIIMSIKRLHKELPDLNKVPIQNCIVKTFEEDIIRGIVLSKIINIYYLFIYIKYMNKFTSIVTIISIGIFTSLIYNNENNKLELIKQNSIFQANKIVIDFFIIVLEETPDITLENAILKFEDEKNEYSTLEEFAKNKNRTVYNYTNAYSKLFIKAKR